MVYLQFWPVTLICALLLLREKFGNLPNSFPPSPVSLAQNRRSRTPVRGLSSERACRPTDGGFWRRTAREQRGGTLGADGLGDEIALWTVRLPILPSLPDGRFFSFPDDVTCFMTDWAQLLTKCSLIVSFNYQRALISVGIPWLQEPRVQVPGRRRGARPAVPEARRARVSLTTAAGARHPQKSASSRGTAPKSKLRRTLLSIITGGEQL